MPSARTTLTCIAALLAGGVLVGGLGAASPKEKLKRKQAQASAVLGQVNALDRRFEASVEAWNGAQFELARSRRELRAAQATLASASRQRRLALRRVRARVVALYESDDDPTTAEIFLGSSSLSEILDRLDAAHAVAAADHRLAVQTTQARNRYAAAVRRKSAIERQREATVRQRDSERRRIGAMLAERRLLLSHVQSEVARLQAEEARRQAILEAQAKARLAREQARLREEAAARARADEAARREARKEAAQKQAAAQQAAPAATTTPATTTTSDPAADPTTTDPLPLPVTTVPTTSTPAPVPAPAPSASLGAGHPEAATIALRYLGVKYVWGGASPAGFDCSGLVMYVYAQLGISLPHYAAAQFGFGTPVPRDQLQPGDLVFFDNLNHVGIYIGGGEMVHAPQTGDVVKITPLSQFGGSYVGARRL